MSDTMLERNLDEGTTTRWERAEWAAALKKAEEAAIVLAEKKEAAKNEKTAAEKEARKEADLRIQASKAQRAKVAGPFAGLVFDTGNQKTTGELLPMVLEKATIKGKVELELFTQARKFRKLAPLYL